MKITNKELFFIAFAAVAAWLFYKLYLRKKGESTGGTQGFLPTPQPDPGGTSQKPFRLNMVENGKKVYARSGGVKVLANEGGYKKGQNYNTYDFLEEDVYSSQKSQEWFLDKINKAKAAEAIKTIDGENVKYVTTNTGGFIGEVESIEIIPQKRGNLYLAKLKYSKPRYLILGFVTEGQTINVSNYTNDFYLI